MEKTEINIIVKAVDKFSKTFGNVKKSAGSLSSSLKKNQATFQKMAGFGTIAFAGMVAGMGGMTKAYKVQLGAEKQVQQGILSTGGIAGKTLEGLKKQASDLQKTSIFGDEDILQNVSAQFLTFGNVTGDVFDRAQKATLDLTTRLYGANASGESMKSTSIQLGKALNDPIAGISSLSRVGVAFTEEQKEQIKILTKSGKLQEAQGIILKELEVQYGGSAKAAADALGPTHQLGKSWGDMKEVIGGGLMPVLDSLAGLISPIVEKFSQMATENPTLIKAITLIVVGLTGFVAIAGTIGLILPSIIGGVGALGTAFGVLMGPVGLIVGAIALFAVAYKKDFLGFRGFVDDTAKKVKVIFDGIVDSVKILYGKISEWVGQFKEPFMEAVEFIQPYISQFLDFMTEYFMNSFENIKNFLSGVWDIIKGIIKVGLSFIGGIINVGISLIKGDWEGAWTSIKNMFAGIWEGIKMILGGSITVIKSVVSQFGSTLMAMFSGTWTAIKNVISGLLGAISGIITGIFSGISSSISGIVGGIYSAVVGKFTGMLDKVRGIYETVKGWIGSIFGMESKAKASSQKVSQYKANAVYNYGKAQNYSSAVGGGFAKGGDVQGGRSILVGERGPELFTPATNGSITTNKELQGSNGGVMIQFGDVNINNGMDMSTFKNEIKKTVIEASRLGNLGFNS